MFNFKNPPDENLTDIDRDIKNFFAKISYFNSIIKDGGFTVQKIQSKEYFDAVKTYFVSHKDPARVYSFLLNTLWTDKRKLSDRMYYERVDMLKMTDNSISFYTGTECALVLCSNPENQNSNRDYFLG